VQVAVDVGEELRLRGDEDGDLTVHLGPADDRRGLPALAKTGLVGRNYRLPLADVVESCGDPVDLGAHQDLVHSLHVRVPEFFGQRCIHVAHILSDLRRGFRHWSDEGFGRHDRNVLLLRVRMVSRLELVRLVR
jgi:hypothetical protein